MKALTVISSNGTLEVNKITGKILSRDMTELDNGLEEITQFDLREWVKEYKKEVPDELDILDLGYWYRVPEEFDERYEFPAEDWREGIRPHTKYNL